MKLRGLLSLFLLLWMSLVVDGEETISNFIRDAMTTFKLTSPTIVYDANEEPPEICYTKEWVLCLSSPNHKSEFKESLNETEKGDDNQESRSKEVSKEEGNEESANTGKFMH